MIDVKITHPGFLSEAPRASADDLTAEESTDERRDDAATEPVDDSSPTADERSSSLLVSMNIRSSPSNDRAKSDGAQ
jgi:hypothetical protein